MPKFSEITYIRPCMISYTSSFEKHLKQFIDATNYTEAETELKEIYKLRRHFDTMMNVASVRHTINTNDKFYEDEQNFYDENLPEYQRLINDFYSALIKSDFKDEIKKHYGKQLFNLAEQALNTFSNKVMEDMKEENILSSEYVKLIASAEIDFRGEKYNLSGLTPFQLSPDRDTRVEATKSFFGFFSKNKNEFDSIYDKLVKVRHRIAVKLGYKNFVELGYARMCRTDYNPDMVKSFRKKVEELIVPVVMKLKERQRKRLGLNELTFYDDGLDFSSGNATPKGSPEWILENARMMYKELSPKTNEFFQFMIKNELMDLENKPNKAAGGYCTFFSEFKAPFIFSNFNGTSHDIDVLTHEAGHAFQGYCSRENEIDEYYYPTLEACEIHSMSMEFLTWPWMKLFFEGEVDKYKFAHLSHAIAFIPYGVAVDEFQHVVYENPEMTPEERNAAWRSIEKKYLPWKTYDIPYLEAGGFWQKQAHIFKSPFYYIDYTLAQLCAFQFWKKSNDNREVALEEYIRLCEAGGSKPFLELVELANLKSPFAESTVKDVVMNVEDWLEKIDDTRLN